MIDAAAWTLPLEDLEVLVLIDRVQLFIDPFTAELVLRPKAIVGLAAKTDHSLSLPFFFKQFWLAFIVGLVLCAGKSIVLVGFEVGTEFGFHQAFDAFSGQGHVRAVRVHLAELEVCGPGTSPDSRNKIPASGVWHFDTPKTRWGNAGSI